MPKDIVIAGACRTAIGKFNGALAETPACDLGAIVIKEAVIRAGISLDAVDEVVMGCVLQAGLGQNVTRQAAIKAGIPAEVPCLTLNNVCGSGLKAINLAAAMINAEEADLVVAGGMENMSAAPYVLQKARFGYRINHGKIIDSMVSDGLWEAFNDYHMGITAENVAEQWGITRQMQDEFAAASQNKCEDARKAGRFDQEIVPVPVKGKQGIVDFAADEYPRDGVTAAAMAALKPVFKPDGTVTAANASGINDGAAAVVVMSSVKAAELGVRPQARLLASASCGVEPKIMGIGPVYSTKKALAKAGLDLADIDLIEANEAFAAQSLAVAKLLGLDMNKVNVNGGAIALGHPIGASGCRILVSLFYEMHLRKSRYGLATLCVGGGMGVSTVVERWA